MQCMRLPIVILFYNFSGFKKKMVAASNRKEYNDLAPWVRSVSNHMWWSCCTSKGDAKVSKHTETAHHKVIFYVIIYIKCYMQLKCTSNFWSSTWKPTVLYYRRLKVCLCSCVFRSCSDDGCLSNTTSLGFIAGKKTEWNTDVSIKTCQ